MGIAYIICMNDSIRGVVIDDEVLAKKKMEELKKEFFNTEQIRSITSSVGRYTDYMSLYYWHINEVNIFN